jgi:integrase
MTVTQVSAPKLRAGLDHRARAGIDAASQALGHADLNTTLGIYGHRDQADREARWRRTPAG